MALKDCSNDLKKYDYSLFTKLGKKTRISLKDNSRQTVAHPCNGRQIGQHEMNF